MKLFWSVPLLIILVTNSSNASPIFEGPHKNSTVCVYRSMMFEDKEPIRHRNPCLDCICEAPHMKCKTIQCKPRVGCPYSLPPGVCCPVYRCPEDLNETLSAKEDVSIYDHRTVTEVTKSIKDSTEFSDDNKIDTVTPTSDVPRTTEESKTTRAVTTTDQMMTKATTENGYSRTEHSTTRRMLGGSTTTEQGPSNKPETQKRKTSSNEPTTEQIKPGGSTTNKISSYEYTTTGQTAMTPNGYSVTEYSSTEQKTERTRLGGSATTGKIPSSKPTSQKRTTSSGGPTTEQIKSSGSTSKWVTSSGPTTEQTTQSVTTVNEVVESSASMTDKQISRGTETTEKTTRNPMAQNTNSVTEYSTTLSASTMTEQRSSSEPITQKQRTSSDGVAATEQINSGGPTTTEPSSETTMNKQTSQTTATSQTTFSGSTTIESTSSGFKTKKRTTSSESSSTEPVTSESRKTENKTSAVEWKTPELTTIGTKMSEPTTVTEPKTSATSSTLEPTDKESATATVDVTANIGFDEAGTVELKHDTFEQAALEGKDSDVHVIKIQTSIQNIGERVDQMSSQGAATVVDTTGSGTKGHNPNPSHTATSASTTQEPNIDSSVNQERTEFPEFESGTTIQVVNDEAAKTEALFDSTTYLPTEEADEIYKGENSEIFGDHDPTEKPRDESKNDEVSEIEATTEVPEPTEYAQEEKKTANTIVEIESPEGEFTTDGEDQNSTSASHEVDKKSDDSIGGKTVSENQSLLGELGKNGGEKVGATDEPMVTVSFENQDAGDFKEDSITKNDEFEAETEQIVNKKVGEKHKVTGKVATMEATTPPSHNINHASNFTKAPKTKPTTVTPIATEVNEYLKAKENTEAEDELTSLVDTETESGNSPKVTTDMLPTEPVPDEDLVAKKDDGSAITDIRETSKVQENEPVATAPISDEVTESKRSKLPDDDLAEAFEQTSEFSTEKYLNSETLAPTEVEQTEYLTTADDLSEIQTGQPEFLHDEMNRIPEKKEDSFKIGEKQPESEKSEDLVSTTESWQKNIDESDSANEDMSATHIAGPSTETLNLTPDYPTDQTSSFDEFTTRLSTIENLEYEPDSNTRENVEEAPATTTTESPEKHEIENKMDVGDIQVDNIGSEQKLVVSVNKIVKPAHSNVSEEEEDTINNKREISGSKPEAYDTEPVQLYTLTDGRSEANKKYGEANNIKSYQVVEVAKSKQPISSTKDNSIAPSKGTNTKQNTQSGISIRRTSQPGSLNKDHQVESGVVNEVPDSNAKEAAKPTEKTETENLSADLEKINELMLFGSHGDSNAYHTIKEFQDPRVSDQNEWEQSDDQKQQNSKIHNLVVVPSEHKTKVLSVQPRRINPKFVIIRKMGQ